MEYAYKLGRLIVENNGVLITGATTGIPYWAAKGAKEAGGISIGLSPATSELEHAKVYKLPTDYFDLIIYTGFNYSGRNLLLTRAADAVVVLCGRVGTLNEFTIAFEDKKPIGVLEGPWPTDDLIKKIIAEGHRGQGKIVYDSDPEVLLKKVLKLVDQERAVANNRSLRNSNNK